MKLTEDHISNIAPQEKPKKLFLGGGLFLLVTPTGGKLWRLKYRLQGKEKLISLGIFPIISLEDAQKRRDEAKKLLFEGFDPSDFFLNGRRRKSNAYYPDLL